MGIKIENLNFTYGNGFRLKDINLEIEEGKLTAILGPNGSGKSTLLKCIFGFNPGYSGNISIDNENAATLSAKDLSLRLSYVPQKSENDFDFTVYETVLMGRHPYHKRFELPSENDFKICEGAMRITGILEMKDKAVNRLSGGESQRVSLARAIAQNSPYIVLDEPVNHLDISNQVSIMKLLKSMIPGKTPVTVMHDINYSREYADEVILMKNGMVMYKGRPEEILEPDILREIYGIEFRKIIDPMDGKTYIIPQ